MLLNKTKLYTKCPLRNYYNCVEPCKWNAKKTKEKLTAKQLIAWNKKNGSCRWKGGKWNKKEVEKVSCTGVTRQGKHCRIMGGLDENVHCHYHR